MGKREPSACSRLRRQEPAAAGSLRRRRRSAALLAVLAVTCAACSPTVERRGVTAIGIESQYADVLSQIAGPHASVRAIETNPNTDPHEYEASPAIAREIAAADLIVENGLGYDSWVDRIIAATENPRRHVIEVRRVLGLPRDTSNPHLWYDPKTMPAVARAIAAALSAIEPAQQAYFRANERKFDASLSKWKKTLAEFAAKNAGTPVAVTEPVADALLEAAGCTILTPQSLQLAIMNGNDPSPQDVATQEALLTGHRVKALIYNRQVSNPLTESFLELARKNGIPVVGVYETMPTPGYSYQTWMQAETEALIRAVTRGVSTVTLASEGSRR
ncbi:MAG: zinc ABC transporter solute-binding protein [Proteobacteria bacterium]|nr:zinc ABC transporter solute-binding protein [Pseudomonadota bacterium]